MPSNSPTVGKFCTPEKPSAFSWSRKTVHAPERVGAVDAGQHRRAPDHRQHLGRHLDHDLVGIAIGEKAGERAAAGHPVAAGVVDHDQVDAARLLALGGKPGAGAAADDRLAARDHGAEPLEERARARTSLRPPARLLPRPAAVQRAEGVDHGGGERGDR